MPATAGMQATAMTQAAAVMPVTNNSKDDGNNMTDTTVGTQETARMKVTTGLPTHSRDADNTRDASKNG
jgi:hypothetical protein